MQLGLSPECHINVAKKKLQVFWSFCLRLCGNEATESALMVVLDC